MDNVQYKVFVLNHMNLPFTIQVVNVDFSETVMRTVIKNIEKIDLFLKRIDQQYSPYKTTSFVSRHPMKGEAVQPFLFSPEYQEIFAKSLWAKEKSYGVFDAFSNDRYDPTGLVKGWAIEKAFRDYLEPLIQQKTVMAAALNGGGDMQVGTQAGSLFNWTIGIENPRQPKEVIATYQMKSGAIATSGLNKRGRHIHAQSDQFDQIQVTVVGDHLTETDMWATVGVAAESSLWQKIIEENQLTGIMLTQAGEGQCFEKGIIYL